MSIIQDRDASLNKEMQSFAVNERLPSSTDSSTEILGEGFKHRPVPLERKKVINAKNGGNNCHFIYWDDPNELVLRLHLLHLSRQAGNSSVTNEILNIEQELREGNYIY